MKKPQHLITNLFTDWSFNFWPLYIVKNANGAAFLIGFLTSIFLPMLVQSITNEMLESTSSKSSLRSTRAYRQEFYDQTTMLSFQRNVQCPAFYRVQEITPLSPGTLAYFKLIINAKQRELTITDLKMNSEWGEMTQATIREDILSALIRRYPSYIKYNTIYLETFSEGSPLQKH